MTYTHRPLHLLRLVTSVVLLSIFLILLSTEARAVTEAPTDQPDPDTAISSDVTTDADDLFPVIEDTATPTPETTTTETIEGVLLLTDSVVTLNANTTSDVFVFGNTITINGEIGNDLFAAANTIIVNGVINGSVRLAANEVVINGVVERNALIFANTIVLEEDSAVFGDTHLYGSTVTTKGQTVNTTIGAETVTLNGIMLGTVESTSEVTTVGSSAEFTTTASIVSDSTPVIAEEARGQQYITTSRSIDTSDEIVRIREVNEQSRFEKRLTYFFFTLLLGIIVVLVWPTLPQRITNGMKERPGATWALGAVILLIAPVLCLLLLFTLIGIPVAIVLFFAYLLALLFGTLATAYLLGQHIVSARSIQHPTWRNVLTLTVGLFILSMAMLTPWIGWFICVLVAMWGLGGIALQCKRKK